MGKNFSLKSCLVKTQTFSYKKNILYFAVFPVSRPLCRYVGGGHPAKRNYYRWMSGEARLTSLYCGGSVRLVCSDQTNIYCGLQGGIVLVFLASSLVLVTRLEEKESHLWQLQVGPGLLVALTEVSVVLWHKHDWSLAARLQYWSEGQPYLHLAADLMVVPGATKYTARLLLYDRQAGSLHRVRDLVHTKVWVVGAHIGQQR